MFYKFYERVYREEGYIMDNVLSVQVEMKVMESDCVELELPSELTQEEMDLISEAWEEEVERCETIDEWINKVRKSIFDRYGKYPAIRYKKRVYSQSELELLQLEQGNYFSK